MIRQHAMVPRHGLVPRVIVLDVRRHAMKNYNYLVIGPGSLPAVIVDSAWEIGKIDLKGETI